ncbi:hypothetical protein [Streptomyces sp. NPDC055287]
MHQVQVLFIDLQVGFFGRFTLDASPDRFELAAALAAGPVSDPVPT